MTLNGELCIDKSDLVSNLQDAVLRAATCSEPVNL
jgi:hypothetical protein